MPITISTTAKCERYPPKRRRRFGGYISHFAVVLMVIGIAASMAYKKQQIYESVRPGQTLSIDGYSWTYEGYDLVNQPEYDGAQLRVAVSRPGSSTVMELRPEMRTYGRTHQPSTEVAILSTLLPPSASGLRRMGEDFYVIPRNMDPADGGAASIEIIVHPMANWLWAGGVVLLLGTIVAYWPERREPEPVAVRAPSPRTAGA